MTRSNRGMVGSWLDGGPTSLDNLLLLCRAHHTTVHTTAWQVRLNPIDPLPEFLPPPGRHRITHGYADCYHHERGDSKGWIRHRTPRR